MAKTYIGPKLRHLRHQHGHTQAQLAKALGVSATYVNLLENNQRSLSVKVLLALSETYGIEAKSLADVNDADQIGALRAITRDPIFSGHAPDLQELRAAVTHAPQLVSQFEQLYKDFQRLAEHVQHQSGVELSEQRTAALPEQQIYSFLCETRNYFPSLEAVAQTLRDRIGGPQDDLYALLKRYLRVTHNVSCEVRQLSAMKDTLRFYDEKSGQVALSEGLDQPNRNFQLAHVVAQIEATEAINQVLTRATGMGDVAIAQFRNELLNYVAAAILMPYDDILSLATLTKYDIDRMALGFGASFEQVCHRLTTLNDPKTPGIPFFLIRVDRAGNVTRRLNPGQIPLGAQGGGCAVWNIHKAFQSPGVTVSQFVQLWDDTKYLTVSRTSDRPVVSRATQDRRVVVSLSCDAQFADQITYSQSIGEFSARNFDLIGYTCHTCPRQKCAQRAHQPLHIRLNFDSNRRGTNRYET